MSRLIVVTGGRKFKGVSVVESILGLLHQQNRLLVVAHGGARGADTFAGEWARTNRVTEAALPVDAKLDGPWPKAGARRNTRLLNTEIHRAMAMLEPLPLVVRFDGGTGTADCAKQALELGLSVWFVRGDGPYVTDYVTPAQWAETCARARA